MATKPKGASKSVSPAQPQTAAPSNFSNLLSNLTALHFTAMEVERNAEQMMRDILMDTPNRELFERNYSEAQQRRRDIKRLQDDVQQVVWQDEKTKALTDDEVQSRYANARCTWYGCGGHYKAARNEALAKEWEWELTRRGLKPDGREGQFNGDGAS